MTPCAAEPNAGSASYPDSRDAFHPPIGVSVLIASIGRETLGQTIRTVRKAGMATGLPHEIIVADDSPSGKAAEFIRSKRLDGPDIKVVHTRSGNISVARNACIDAASGRFLAFIDDDEWAPVDWLTKHLRVIEEFAADGSLGAVRAQYAETTPNWIRYADPFSRGPRNRGVPLAAGSTANALVRRDAIVRHGLRFDESLGRTGGEDIDLFWRVTKAGGILVTGDSVVDENIPVDRCTLQYLLARGLRHGQTYARRAIATRGRAGVALFYADAMVKLLAGTLLAFATLAFGRRRSLPWLLSAARNVGKLRELFQQELVVYYIKTT